MRKRTLIALAVALLAIPLILVVTNQLEGVVSELIWYGMWLGDHLFKAIPQVVYWVLLLITAVVLAVLSLARRRRRVRSVEARRRGQIGQVQQLAESIRRMPNGDYFKRQIAWRLRPLVLEAAHRRGWPAAAAGGHGTGVQTNALPPQVQAFLAAGAESAPPGNDRLISRLLRRLLRHATPAFDVDLEGIVQFVEEGLEVAYDH